MADASEIENHLEVKRDQTVTGLLRSGATVRAGAQLTVNGAIEGDVSVEKNAVLMVMGTFLGNVVRNDGTILLYGFVDFEGSRPVGRVGVGVESIVEIDGDTYSLGDDGALSVVRGTVPAGSFTVNTANVCLFDARDGKFRPSKPR